MRIRYSQWLPESATDEQRLQQMLSLFSYLVVQTSGDVQEALDWLKQLAEEYGLFDENLTMDELIDKLREMGIIEDISTGLHLTMSTAGLFGRKRRIIWPEQRCHIESKLTEWQA